MAMTLPTPADSPGVPLDDQLIIGLVCALHDTRRSVRRVLDWLLIDHADHELSDDACAQVDHLMAIDLIVSAALRRWPDLDDDR